MQTATTGMIKNNIIVGFGTAINVSGDSTIVNEGNI